MKIHALKLWRGRWWSRKCRIHLSARTQQKYIYIWRNSHWKLTGDWQKYSSKTKAVRKSHMEGREVIRSGQQMGGITQVETLHEERVVRATYWMPLPWCPTPGRQVNLAGWKASGNNAAPHWGEGWGAVAKAQLSCEGWKWLRPRVVAEQGGESRHWHLHKQGIRSSPGL